MPHDLLTIDGEFPTPQELSETRRVQIFRLPRGARSVEFLEPVIGQLEEFQVPEGSRVRADFSVLERATSMHTLDLAGAHAAASVDLSTLPRLETFVAPPPRKGAHSVISALANPHLRHLEVHNLTESDLDLVRAELHTLHVWRSINGITGIPPTMPLRSLSALRLYRMPAFEFGWIARADAVEEIEVWRVGHLSGLGHLVERPRVRLVIFEDCPRVDDPALATQVNADQFVVVGSTTIDRDAVERAFPPPADDSEPLQSFWSFGPFGNAVAMDFVARIDHAETAEDVAAIVDAALVPVAIVDADRTTIRSALAAAAVVAAAVGAVFEEPVTMNGAYGTPLATSYHGPMRWGPGSWEPAPALVARALELVEQISDAPVDQPPASLVAGDSYAYRDVVEALASPRAALARARGEGQS